MAVGAVRTVGGGGDDGDGNGSGDGDESTPTATPTGGDGDSPQETATDTPTETAEETQTETSSNPTLGQHDIAFEDNFRFRIDYSDYEKEPADMAVTGEWNDRDLHLEVTYEGRTMDLYYVGDSTYLEASGHCGKVNRMGDDVPDLNPRDWAETDSKQRRIEEWSDLEASGKTTLEGETVWIYNFQGTVDGDQYQFTYYVDSESGRLRRVEVQRIVIEY